MDYKKHLLDKIVAISTVIAFASGYFFTDGNNDDLKIFNYNQYLRQTYTDTSGGDSKTKVETLGSVLKRHIQDLKETSNKQVDIIFLVDSSTSVGKHNFIDEIKFVKQLLSDFTVDVNHTRVAVITFSSSQRVVRHIDYLDAKQKDRHKCRLLEDDLRKITYSGGGTYTLGAFLEAKRVLKNARPTASKAIFLVTDGFSNGGDPRPEAEFLKKAGVKVYTFGIQNGNVRELYDMASEPKNESCYILDSFEEFEALARRALHEDLTVGTYIKQPLRKCRRLCVGKRCCDTMADCSCGIHTGKYECVCPAGYYGNGLKGGCQACPAGTYKPSVKSGDVYTCTKCPDEHHTSELGSISVDACVCSKGFRALNSSKCAVLTCPQLEAPNNGYFVNNRCKSVLNAACGLRCKQGFDLQGSGLRICREDGTWSGTDTQCIMKTCPALMKPKNGNMICTTDDFTFNTVCRFTCDTGYKLLGSRKRTCLAIAFWTGIITRCREVKCQPLSLIRDGSIQPSSCTTDEVAFGTTCSVTCHSGYSLIGPHSKQCLPEGLWSTAAEASQCEDTTAPFIMCPYHIDTVTDPNENTATVQWEVPLAVDNSGYVPILTSVPAVIPPSEFPMGATKVTYIAEDLNKNEAVCYFMVKVMDKQKPTVDRCYSPLPVVSSEPYTYVSWEEPLFSDNSDQDVFVRRSHAPGLFPMGKTTVTYTAYDQSGNNNTCEVVINVISHSCMLPPMPLNGNRTCFEDDEGVVCQFFCLDGYTFAIEPAPMYTCAFDNKWEPANKIPVSDCSAIQLSNDIIQPASFTFAGHIACQQRVLLLRLEKDFEHRVSKRVNELCEEDITCSIQDLETTCEHSEDFNKIRVTLGTDKLNTRGRRARREVRVERSTITETELIDGALITFKYDLASSVAQTGSATMNRAKQKQLKTTVNNIVTTLRKDAKRGDLNLKVNGKTMELTDMSLDHEPVFVCHPGSVLKEQSCVACPEGTYYNVITEVCDSCGIGTYQPNTGQLTCLVCPVNMTTTDIQTTNESQCKALCLPGTKSPNGLEICETCSKGYFEVKYGQTNCTACPVGFTTKRRGARELSDCKEKCTAGYASMSGFVPCYPCPIGTYQPDDGKSACIKCPQGADTMTSASTNSSYCEIIQSDSPQNDGPGEDGEQQHEEEEFLFNACSSSPCMNGAECTPKFFNFECQCQPGYQGVVCQTEVNECADDPCLNGICVDLLADYKCLCHPGFEGEKCEINIDDCIGEPCENGATCIDGIQDFKCECANGFEGSKCELNIDDCKEDSCLNGGVCIDEVASYSCVCPDGITGDNCEIDEDDCASGPCLNDGDCFDDVGGFRCECPFGFKGIQCEIDIDECASSPCSAVAKCEDLPGGFQCHCPSGFKGEDCSQEIDIYFQLDFPTTASTTDYARVKMGPDLTAATVCFWMKSDDTSNQGTPFSYATEEGDNILTLTDYDGFAVYVNGEKESTTIQANDGIWHHICLLWSSNRGAWKIYMDGSLEQSGENLASGQTVKGGGTFVIGQEQDSLGGGFSSPESFIGKLSQLNVWGSELPLKKIESLRLSCEKQLGDVIAWPDISQGIRGSVVDQPVDFCKECPIPSNIEYGKVQSNGLTAGSIATYTCNRGFDVAGRDERQCLVTGEWEGSEPTCTRVFCGFPGNIRNGWIDGQRFTFDNRIRYSCKKGFERVGPATRYCGEDGRWEGEEPSCEEIMCVIPELSENTKVLDPKPNMRYRLSEDAFFECTSGHDFYTEHTSVKCQKDGTWDKSIPTCDPQKCEYPLGVDNGRVKDKDTREMAEFPVGFVIEFECDFGYEIDPSGKNPTGRISCLPTGHWEDNRPSCRVVHCDEPTPIRNGKYEVIRNEPEGESSEYVFLNQVVYSCDLGYELSHDDFLECYETGDWNPSPPKCNAVRCGQPDYILHGSFQLDKDTYGGVAHYLCHLGYTILGGTERRCLENATWSGEVPVCKPISCGRPEKIEHGRFRGRDFTLNHVVTYSCNEGYRLVGSKDRTCRETGKWQNEPPTCTKVECEYPPSIDNGIFRETSFFYQDNVTYQCDEGYKLQGKQILTCQSDSRWSSAAPDCIEIICSTPPSIAKGVALNPQALETFVIGHIIQYQCDTGYEFSQNSLNPTGQVHCLVSGNWEANLPVCQLVQCPPPQGINNGKVDVDSLTYLSVAKYSCDEAFRLTGESQLICQSDKSWSVEPPVCSAIMCEPPNPIEHGDIDYKDLKLGSVVRYMCNDGYSLKGIEVRRCLASLSWTGQEPSCQPVECGKPEDVVNGVTSYTDTHFQSIVTYSCVKGYILIGNRIRTCQDDKNWSAVAPVCEIVQCDKPSMIISNGRMIGNDFSYNSVIEYQCDIGYNIEGSDNLRKCQADGDWDRPIPVCQAVECRRLNIRHGFVDGFQTEYGTTLSISCRPGYRLEGPTERTCMPSGEWSGEETVCVKYACPRLNPPVNGQVLVEGLVATYQCLAGYELSGHHERKCQADNKWSHIQPSCDPIPCPDITLNIFPNGFLTYDKLVYGSQIVYECNTGFIGVGSKILDCLIDGSWSGEAPFCEKIQCFEPHKNLFSQIEGNDFSFNATVTYTCEIGFKLHGEPERICQANGFWSGIAPTCDFIRCPVLIPHSNTKVSESANTYNSVVEYSCNPGYELIGILVRTCLANGSWSGSEPTCLRIECPEPAHIENGIINGNSYNQGSRITYECNEGYRLKGLSIRLCLGTKKWTGADPRCVKKKCPKPPSLLNGYFTGDKWYFQDIVEYGCDQGYDLKGKRERQCSAKGQWSTADTSCVRVRCRKPVLPENVVFTLSDDAEVASYEMQARLSCMEGYLGVGTNYQYCQENGAWSQTNFRCKIVTCPKFLSIQNGQIGGDSFEYNKELTVNCDKGYKLIGPSSFHCLATGQWDYDSVPRCEQITCPDLPPLGNGIILKNGENMVYLSEVSYACDQGYKLSGEEKRICLDDGKWSGQDTFCQLIICDEPPLVENAKPFDPSRQYLYNSEARYVCETGYYISAGDSLVTCSKSGDWEGISPTCTRLVCGNPPLLKHGKAKFNSDDYDSVATYSCDDGYRLKGSSMVRCDSDGNWSGNIPTCVAVNCGQPPFVDNAIIIDSEQHSFRSIVTYICDVGYKLVGQQSSTCLATGVWSGHQPFCKPISCGTPPHVQHAKLFSDGEEYKSVVKYTCETGYEMMGHPSLECGSNGLWIGTPPQCEKVSCGLPPVFPHSSTTMSMGSNFGSTAIFICNNGYYIVGSSSATCSVDKTWAYEAQPSCQPVDCGPLQDIQHGILQADDTTYNSIAEYACMTGYSMAGDAKLRCGANGKWTGKVPSCEQIDCGPLKETQHASLLIKDTLFDSIAEYVCDRGHHDISGVATTLRCDSNGHWKGLIPSCVPVDCEEPVKYDHVLMSGSSFTYQSVLDFGCDIGYKLVGESRLVCTENGDWSNTPPQCLRISCGPLLVPEHGLMVLGDPVADTFYGDSVELGCDEGYTLIGQSELTCLETGLWSTDVPDCIPPLAALTCPGDSDVPHSKVLLDSQPVGSEIEVQCEEGYQSEGSMVTYCQEDQTWTTPEGQCQRVFCGKPRLRDFVNVVRISGTSYFYGDKIKFTCRAGVQPARSPPVVTCTSDGKWDGEIRCGVTCKQPCLNGGICLGLNRCKCPHGFVGRRCQDAICILPCLNGGKCVKPFQCSCPLGYTGVRCNKALCDQPCQHGGKCQKPNKCWCPKTYTGAFCQKPRYP